MTCEQILLSNSKTLNENIKLMEITLDNYNNAIMRNVREEISNRNSNKS